MAWTAVKPPARPRGCRSATVSASSRPGSRRWVWRSTRPGSAIRPVGVDDVASAGVQAGADAAIVRRRSGRPWTSPPQDRRATDTGSCSWLLVLRIGGRAWLTAGSLPPSSRYSTAIRTGTPLATCSTIVERGGVGDLGGDLHAAVHRAGVHDDPVLGQLGHALAVQAVAPRVLALGREERGVHPLALHAQHHHRVGLRAARRPGRTTPRRPVLDADRQQRRRGDQGDLGAERVQQQTLERATRLCSTSPTMVMRAGQVLPSASLPTRRRRIVNASSSAWVGCSWVPSPALMTAASIQPEVARR